MIRLLKNIILISGGFLTGKRAAGRPSTRKEPPLEDQDRRSELKTFLKRLGMLVPVLALVGFLVAVSGIIPLKASSGHWAITAWFLNFTMERSVVTHSIGIKVPPLDDPVLVLKGAGHYDIGCRPCHGSPGFKRPRIPQQMTPHPPYLGEQVPIWEPEELFYIVKHGVKFTGMPAWPAQSRDDEVWAVVAFLQRLPDLDVETYAQIVEGPAAAPTRDTTSADIRTDESAPVQGLINGEDSTAPAAVTDRCGRCHGLEGGGRDIGAFPRLDGQRPHYLFASLKAYADGERNSGIMQPIAAGLTIEEMREIAFYYSRLDAPPSSPAESDPSAIARGEEIAHEGIPLKRVPSCADCHGPGTLPRNPFYPNLAGQYAEYIKLQLELFKDDHRGGSVYSRLMHPTAEDLTEEEMKAVALYYASLE